MFCHISAVFEHIDLKLCTHINQPLLPNIYNGFLNKKVFEGEHFEKEKQIENFGFFFEIFKISKTQNSRFLALLILRHFI